MPKLVTAVGLSQTNLGGMIIFKTFTGVTESGETLSIQLSTFNPLQDQLETQSSMV